MSSTMDVIMESISRFLLDPRYHDLLAILKGLRNGLVYGAKVRFPHALVMILLFRTGTLREKLAAVFKATRTHSKNLAMFVTLYKTSMYVLSQLNGAKGERSADSFISGLLGGYVVFGRGSQSSVNQQIVIYVFARVALALAKLSVGGVRGGEGEVVRGPVGTRVAGVGWPVFASLSWALVMWLFRWHPESIQPSLRSSMKYLYVNSDTWTSFKTFLIHNT